MYTFPQPALVLAVVLVLAVACSLSAHPNKRHLDRRRRTLPPQWRDPCISSLLLPLLLLLSLLLPLFLLLFVLPRHSERSEESPHFQGERSDPSAFLSHPAKHRYFDWSSSSL